MISLDFYNLTLYREYMGFKPNYMLGFISLPGIVKMEKKKKIHFKVK